MFERCERLKEMPPQNRLRLNLQIFILHNEKNIEEQKLYERTKKRSCNLMFECPQFKINDFEYNR